MIQTGFVRRRKRSIPGRTPEIVEERCSYSRQFLNKIVVRVRTIFSWGGSQGLVSSKVYGDLKFVRPLRLGRSRVPEAPARTVVSCVDFEKTLPLLSPIYQDFVRVLKLTAMRPSELCRMRKGEIDRDSFDGVWLYRPGSHKNLHRSKIRAIPLGERSQAILTPRLDGKSDDDFVFSPAEALEEHFAEARRRRRTNVQPSQAARDERNRSTRSRRSGKSFDPRAVGRYLKKKIDAANRNGIVVVPWTLYQLRHTTVSEIAIREGEIAAQRLAGHASLNTTEIYNHAAILEAIDVAKKYG